jgi:UDP-N-acetylglucosamine 3-dehydrogenase
MRFLSFNCRFVYITIYSEMKVAVIGAGNMGKNHIRTYSENNSVKLVAISDIDAGIGQSLANEYHTNFYSNWQQMIQQEKPDAISICVPTSLHFDIASECIRNRIHLLIEKPIATSIKDSQTLNKLAKEHEVTILIGHIERFNPAVIKTKQIIEQGTLGQITAITARRVGGFPPQIKDVDIAVDLAIHDIDIVCYLLSELPREVVWNKQKHHTLHRADSIELFCTFDKSSAYIQANWITPVKIRKLTITGTEGYLEMDYINQNIEFYKSNYKKFKDPVNDYSEYILIFSDTEKQHIKIEKQEPLKEEINYFIRCIKNHTRIDIQYAIDALKIALQTQ